MGRQNRASRRINGNFTEPPRQIPIAKLFLRLARWKARTSLRLKRKHSPSLSGLLITSSPLLCVRGWVSC